MKKYYCDICGKEISGHVYVVKFFLQDSTGVPETREYCSKECYQRGMYRMIMNSDISEIDVMSHYCVTVR